MLQIAMQTEKSYCPIDKLFNAVLYLKVYHLTKVCLKKVCPLKKRPPGHKNVQAHFLYASHEFLYQLLFFFISTFFLVFSCHLLSFFYTTFKKLIFWFAEGIKTCIEEQRNNQILVQGGNATKEIWYCKR